MDINLRIEQNLHPLCTDNKRPFKSGYKFHGSQRKREINQFYISRVKEKKKILLLQDKQNIS